MSIDPDMMGLDKLQADKKRRAMAAMALRGLADLIDQAELSFHHGGNVSEPFTTTLDGLSFGFELGDYLADVTVAQDAVVSQLSQSDCETDGASRDVVSKGHLCFSVLVDVEAIV